MAFDWVDLVRVLHVLAAAIWVGGAVLGTIIIGPAVKAAGKAGQEFMKIIGQRGGFAKLMGPAGVLTILSGLVVYWQRDYWGGPFANGPAIVLSVSAILGLAAFVAGFAVGLPLQKKMGAMAAQIGPGGPSPQQQAAMESLGKKFTAFGHTITATLVVVLLLMAGRGLA